jgi:hypothetical protein
MNIVLANSPTLTAYPRKITQPEFYNPASNSTFSYGIDSLGNKYHSIPKEACPEQSNHVCNFNDCPCQPKYKSLTEEMVKGRFLNEIK